MASIRAFDYRTDEGNVVVTPEIRCRFMTEPPGDNKRSPHSHDGAGEVFIVLEGQVEFDIEGETVVAGPGQLVYCPPYFKHTFKVIGETPARLYLSVSPHKEPTHTVFDDEGHAKHIYGGWRSAGMPKGRD